MNASEHKNYWTPTIVMCVCLIVLVGALAIFFKNQMKGAPPSYAIPQMPTKTTQTDAVVQKFAFPSGLSQLSQGTVWLDDSPIVKDGKDYFLLYIQKYIFERAGDAVVFNIPVVTDAVSSPKVSYNAEYGCVTIGSSGYSGYYIFSLPSGEKIDQGKQYSQCVEWVSENEVIVNESPYNDQKYSYYLINVKTKAKKMIYEGTRDIQKEAEDTMVKPMDLMMRQQ